MKIFPFIDILRAFAAILVIVFHVIHFGEWTAFPVDGFLRIFRIGWIGVDLFFVISGFVIGGAALYRYEKSPGSAFSKEFAERRVRRIAPLYFLTGLVYFFVVNPELLQLPWSVWSVHVGAHALFLHNLHPLTHGSINGPNWSVALEMQFYLLIILITPWLAKASGLKIIGVAVVLAMGWRFAMTQMYPATSPEGVNNLFVFSTQLPGVIDAFAFGIVLAKLTRAKWFEFDWRAFFGIVIACIFMLAACWILYWKYPMYWSIWWMVVVWRTILSLAFAGLVLIFALFPCKVSWFISPFCYLGKISYGLYLWHLPVLLTLVEKTNLRGVSLLYAVLCGTIVMSSFSWHAFEKLWLKPRTLKFV